jgi:lysophospholipase L1-like esterase
MASKPGLWRVGGVSWLRACVLAGVATMVLPGASPVQSNSQDGFAGTWETSDIRPQDSGPSTGLTDQTERATVHTSIGGSELRVRLSNVYGSQPVTFDDVTVAERATGASVVAGTIRGLTFDARRSVTIPTGREVLSDAVQFRVGPEQDLAISLAANGSTGPATLHPVALTRSYLSRPGSGDHAGDEGGGAFATKIRSWLFVDGVDVMPSGEMGAIVAFGDSITDGYQSTFDANRRWPDALARRIQVLPEDQRKSVLNAGISGNRLLLDSPLFGVRATDRLTRDVLRQTGVTDAIVLLGINDIGQLPHQFDAGRIIAALRQIAARSRAAGLRVFGGTLLPFKNTTIEDFYTPQGGRTRQAVNRWIRTGNAFDGVIDFDRIMRSPSDPMMLNPALDSGDHLHPNDLGYQVMADSIDLTLFSRPRESAPRRPLRETGGPCWAGSARPDWVPARHGPRVRRGPWGPVGPCGPAEPVLQPHFQGLGQEAASSRKRWSRCW